MENDDLVCICIPTFERADILRLCLQSIFNQSYRNIQIHIFDNSKTEAVRELVEQIGDRGRISYQRNSPNVSDVIEINHGKAFAPQDGRYQMILTSDWALRSDCIARMVAALKADDGIIAVTSGYEIRREAGHRSVKPERLAHLQKSGAIDTRKLIYAGMGGFSGIGICYHALIDAEVLRRGLIAPVYPGQATEHEVALDLAIIKPRLGVINECLLIGHDNDEHYNPPLWRSFRKLSETVARARFFDRHLPELIAKGFDTERMQRALVRRFVSSAFAEPAHAGSALMLAKRYGMPWLLGLLLWWTLLPLRAVSCIGKSS